MIWNPKMETMSREELRALQSERLIATVKRVYDNVPAYRAKMDAIGLKPEDIKSVDDITKLPFTTKSDLRDNYPFGLFAVPQDEIVRVHASSGTTGKPTVVGYTAKDIEMWSECVARCMTMAGITKKDIVQVAYGYGLFTGGLGAHYGAEYIGATTVPMGTGNTQKLVTLMKDFGATAIACTPSYLLHISEVLKENGEVENLKRTLHIHAHDIYGLSEVMGPGVACDCEYHEGLHVCEDYFIPEIISPTTLEPVPDGETGELVFTTISKEGLPLIRYRTRDLTSINYEKCKCGRTTCRISRFKGRSDDMLIIRGVNVFPSQVEEALLSIDGVSPHYMIIVDRVNNLDTLEIMVEVDEKFFSDEIKGLEALSVKIGKAVQQMIGLNAKIKLVEPRTIERSMGKAVRVTDKRKLI